MNASVEELRAFARGRIDQLKCDLPATERANRLRIAVDEAHLGDVLQMLVIAEDSLYQWQRLRIQRARGTEPHHVEEIIRFAREQMAADLKADAELVRDLRRALIEYAEPHPLEAARFLSRKRIAAGIDCLRTQLDEFVEARRLQVTEWPAIEQPTIRDARIEIGRRAVEGGRAARRGGTEVIDLTVAKAKQAGRTVADRARRVGRGE